MLGLRGDHFCCSGDPLSLLLSTPACTACTTAASNASPECSMSISDAPAGVLAAVLTCRCFVLLFCACQYHFKVFVAVAVAAAITAAAAVCAMSHCQCMQQLDMQHQASKEDDSAAEKGSGAGNWAFKYVLNKARESVNKLVNKEEAAPAPEGMQGNTLGGAMHVDHSKACRMCSCRGCNTDPASSNTH